jgi:membrane-associated phospholipid phosphatase
MISSFYNHIYTNRKRLLNYLVAFLSIGFILLTILVTLFPPTWIDIDISKEVQEHHSILLDQVMTFVSLFGYAKVSVVMVTLTALLFYLFKYKTEALYTLFTLISGLISSLIKIIVNRPRPTENLVRIIEKAKQQSFPSGHALFYTMFFGFMLYFMLHLNRVNKFIRILVGSFSFLMIFLVPFSRMYLGAHWFTDVTAGIFLGILCLYLLCLLYLKRKSKLTANLTLPNS